MGSQQDSSITKAKRLLRLRKLAKLSRQDISEIANVSSLTYKGWENARFGGIPLKRAVLLTDLLQTQGIKCSTDWLMEGIGEPPQKILHYQLTQLKDAIKDPYQQSPEAIEELRTKAELEFFCNNNNWETLSYTVSDNTMEPYFLFGDLVAGKKIPTKDFDKIEGLNCIIRIKNNRVLLRHIQSGNINGGFTLTCLNPKAKQSNTFHDAELIEVAPISWIKRTVTLLTKTDRTR